MIPLGLSRGGSLLVGHTEGSRRMWLCLTSTCIQRVVDDPRHIARAIRGRPPSTSDLRPQLQVYFSTAISNALQDAAKSGVIVHGSQRVANCLAENITTILFSANAGAEIRSRIGDKKNKVQTYIIPLSSAEIGVLLGRGPRSVLALRPGRRTQSLIETLRGWDSLG
jgi:hypothetical protein